MVVVLRTPHLNLLKVRWYMIHSYNPWLLRDLLLLGIIFSFISWEWQRLAIYVTLAFVDHLCAHHVDLGNWGLLKLCVQWTSGFLCAYLVIVIDLESLAVYGKWLVKLTPGYYLALGDEILFTLEGLAAEITYSYSFKIGFYLLIPRRDEDSA